MGPGCFENQKMVLVNSDQYLKSYLWSILYWNLKKVNHPNVYSIENKLYVHNELAMLGLLDMHKMLPENENGLSDMVPR